MTVHLTREQLYQLVWSESIKRLSKQIGISDVAIAKHCRKLNVPVPERGYWAKLQARQRVIQPSLPPRDLGTPTQVKMAGTLGPELLTRINSALSIDDPEGESIALLSERFRQRLGNISAPRNYSKGHPAITNLLKKGEILRRQFLGRSSPWNRLRSSSATEQRRLRIINGLFLAFYRVGWRALAGADARELRIRAGKVTAKCKIDVVAGMTNAPPKKGWGGAYDRLFVSISDHHKVTAYTTRWEDRDECLLEQQLTDVVVGIAVVAELLLRRGIKTQAPWLQQGEARRSAHEVDGEAEQRPDEPGAAEEDPKRLALLASAAAWREANNVRAYVAAVRNATEGNLEKGQFETWARWALSQANRIDPLSSGRVFGGPDQSRCGREPGPARSARKPARRKSTTARSSVRSGRS
jgi:hypothetical protein